MVVIADVASIGFFGSGSQLIAPLAAAVCLSSVGDIGRRLLFQIRYLIYDSGSLKEIEGSTFPRIETERGMKPLAHLVAVDECPHLGRHHLVRQLPGLVAILRSAQLVVLQAHGIIARVIKFHPGIWEILEVIHDTVHVRLHQFIDNQLSLSSLPAQY